MRMNYVYFAIMVANVATFAAVAVNLWMQRRDAKRAALQGQDGAFIPVLKAASQLLRAELLAGGRGKHYAYHVSEDGLILRVDAVQLYLALFAGVEDFWQLVASAGGEWGDAFAVTLDEIDFGDGKGHFTYIHGDGYGAFVDGIVPDAFPRPYYSARVTAEEFKDAVVDAQAEAAKRKRACYAEIFHR